MFSLRGVLYLLLNIITQINLKTCHNYLLWAYMQWYSYLHTKILQLSYNLFRREKC
jgi:hypothetical protein